jgi:septal ring factor EnvC (AmiA/AmiB activator)
MKKTRRIILGSIASVVILVCLQVFSSGHSHVVVVDDNNRLTKVNKGLKIENKQLSSTISKLEEDNSELTEDKQNLQSMVSEVIGDLDSTSSVVKDIKKELQNEKDIIRKQSTGKEFDFQPITLPSSDGN